METRWVWRRKSERSPAKNQHCVYEEGRVPRGVLKPQDNKGGNIPVSG